ncbi:MAG: PAS domain S-box protein, partial [Thermoplasmatota archaeon]
IDRTLGLIGNFVGIDRSYVFLFDEEDGVINNTHEWCAEGIESQIDKLQDIPISLLSWSMEQLESGLSIHIPRVEDLPPEAEEEKKMSQMQDIQSILLVPLTWKNELKGFMGFDSVKDERSWESEDVILLDTFSDIITNTLERKKAESALKESEERYRELVESSFAGIGITTLDEDFIFVNDRFAEMLGYEKDELIGKNIADICPEDELDIFNKETKIRKKGKRGSYESKLLKNNGNSISVKIYANPYKDSDGSIIGTTGVVTDITNIKKAEHALKESETKIKKLYDSSVVFSSIDNLEELYTKVIEIASDILDFDVCTVSIETNGRLVVKASTEKELVNNYSLPVDEGIVGKTYRKKKSYLIRDVKQDPDSEPTDIRFRSGISLPIGNYGAFQALSYKDEYYDENDLELAELFISHIEEAVRRIEVKERESLLHSLLRHDVKNKAQIVHGYLQLLNDLDISKEGRTFLEKSLKANKDSVNLIDKIGLLIKAKEEKVKEVNLTSVIAETVENFSKFAESKNIEIRTDFSDEVGMVKAGSLLEEVFSNLIENAINHSECSKIMISRRDQEEFIITSIEDDGIGIPEDKKELIFKKGYTTDKGRGTGLGLFLVKMLLDEYEGDIEVKNSKMDGSKFEVKLKRAH